MSDVSDAAAVRLLIADYAAADAGGKLNVVGGGLTIVGFNPGTGLTAPFYLVVVVTVPPRLNDAEASVEIILEDGGGQPVLVPGLAGAGQPLRIGQAVTFERPAIQGAHLPVGTLGARMQWALGFTTGLPLGVGQLYAWRVKIDTETRPEWVEYFYVPGPPPGPVIG